MLDLRFEGGGTDASPVANQAELRGRQGAAPSVSYVGVTGVTAQATGTIDGKAVEAALSATAPAPACGSAR